MTIPAAFTRTTVTDELYELDGTLATGALTFRPSAGVLVLDVPPDDAFSVLAGALTLSVPVVAGTFSLDVPATDVEGVTPTGWYWLVTLKTTSRRYRWSKLVPVSADPLRLTQLVDWVDPRNQVGACWPTPWHAGYVCSCAPLFGCRCRP